MADVKWIKICTDIFDDEKMLLIESMPEADSLIVIWFKLLCMAGKQNNSGVFMLNDKIAYTDEMLSTVFRRPINTVRLALKTFESYGMVEIVDNVLTIPNWEKHQSLDKLEAARAKTRQRVAAYREKQKLITSGNGYSNVTVTPCNAADKDIDRDIDKDIDKEKKESTKKKTASRFTPPTLEEVQAYCLERGNNIDAEHFIAFYTANGWKQSNGNPIKDWKACVITWEKRDKQRQKETPKQQSGSFLDDMQEAYNRYKAEEEAEGLNYGD